MAKPPTTSVVRQLKKEGKYPNLLSIQAVDTIFYGQAVPRRDRVPARAPERQASQKRRRPTARVLFDSGLPDYTAVDQGGEVVVESADEADYEEIVQQEHCTRPSPAPVAEAKSTPPMEPVMEMLRAMQAQIDAMSRSRPAPAAAAGAPDQLPPVGSPGWRSPPVLPYKGKPQ